MSPPWQRKLVGVAGLVAVGCFLALVARFWHPVYGLTAFFQLDGGSDDYKITAFRELPVYVHRDTGGYDGLYYAQIAQDPSLRHPELPRAMDNFSYRARRILPPALAWLLGAGRPAGIVHAYSLLNIAAWLALAGLLWRLLGVRDLHGWIAWAGLLFSAGALSSVRLALSDLIALAIAAAALLAVEQWRGRLAVALLSAATLARETSLLAVAGLLKPPWFSVKNVARVALAAAPLAAWILYIRFTVGSADQGWSNFTWPIVGLIEKLREAGKAVLFLPDQTLAWTTLLALVGLLVQAAYFVVRPLLAERWWRIGAAYTLMLLGLGTAVWEGYPGAATRVLLPLNLAFNILAHRARAPLSWLLMGNLTVFSGLLAMRDVPRDPHELAATRAGNVACIARFGGGWYGREEHRSHTWAWTDQHGTLTLETWPRTNAPVQLEFAMRSLAPRTVTLQFEGREIWRASIGLELSRHVVPLQVSGGRATLTFATDTPGVPESTAADARALGFALYDLQLALP